MKPGKIKNDKQATNTKTIKPVVSVFMPFEPKMAAKAHLHYRLMRAVEMVEKQLTKRYPLYNKAEILQKFKKLVSTLDFNSHKKSVALFVSAATEKVFYLDIVVEEKIIIDKSFQIRDIVLNKQSQQRYLLLVLSNTRVKLYLGKNDKLTRLMKNSVDNIVFMENDISERVSNFSDPDERKEILAKKFIKHIDEGLNIVLKAYPLPLLLACTVKTKGYFMQISRNVDRVVEYVPGNYEDATEMELKLVVQPFLDDWQKTREKDMLVKLNRAMNLGKCAAGIDQVRKALNNKMGKLLIVEKNFRHSESATPVTAEDLLEERETSPVVYDRDMVEEMIEKVLDNGGDVQFVSDGALDNYRHIALITYY